MKVPKPKKQPSGNWFIQLRLGGESVPITAKTKDACIQEAKNIKHDYLAGRREQKMLKLPDMTIRQAIDAYIAAKENSLSVSTVRGYRIIQNNRFQGYMDIPLKDITNWQDVYNSEKFRLSPKSLKNSFGFLRSVYTFATGGHIPNVDMLPVPKAERPVLMYDQIPTFLDAVRGKKCEIGALLALSSLRCSELLNLTWDDIDIKRKTIKVSGAMVLDEHNKLVQKDTNKTAASTRIVPIFIPQLVIALKAEKDKTGYVVYHRTQPGLRNAIDRCCIEAGLPEVGIHGLRHSFASLAVHLGIPEETAMQIGGWSDFVTMRKIYTHASQLDVQRHTSELENFFQVKKK